MSETCDFERLLIPRVATRSFILRVDTPFQVAGGDHGGQGTFGPGAPFQQPVREERAGSEFGHGDVDGADPGVEVAVAVAVSDVGASITGGGVVGAADLVGLGREDLVDEALQHLSHQVRGGLGQ